MKVLRNLAVASFLAVALTAATADVMADPIPLPPPPQFGITSVILSPDPPIALDPVSLLIDGNYDSTCQSVLGAEAPITAPGTIGVNYVVGVPDLKSSICHAFPDSHFHEEVPWVHSPWATTASP